MGEAEASSAVLCVDGVLSSLLKGERKGRRKEQGEGRRGKRSQYEGGEAMKGRGGEGRVVEADGGGV